MTRKRLIGLGIAIVIVVGLTMGIRAFTAPGAPGGMPNHITITQAIAESGQVVKVGGDVVPGSINWDNANRWLTFMLTEDGERMPVAYRGVAPSDFKPGIAMVVEGTYASRGVFEATSMTTTSSPLCKACHG